jgi:hypothetical protein
MGCHRRKYRGVWGLPQKIVIFLSVCMEWREFAKELTRIQAVITWFDNFH